MPPPLPNRPQPYRLEWPLNQTQLEHIDYMFEILFKQNKQFTTSIVNSSSFTKGSIIFAGSNGGLSQDNKKFFWDDTNFRLGIGNSAPTVELDVTGSLKLSGSITLTTNPSTGIINLGTNPAQSGVIRIGANSVGIQFRNNANTADCGAFTSDGADNIILGFNSCADVIFKPANIEQARIKTGAGVQAVAGAAFYWNGRAVLLSPADAQITLTNNAQTSGFGLQMGTADTMIVANKAQNAFGSIQALQYRAEATGQFFFNSRSIISSPLDAQMNLTNNAATSGVGLQLQTDGTLIVANRAQNAYGFVDAKYKAEGTAGVASFGPSAVASITVKDGIITAIS